MQTINCHIPLKLRQRRALSEDDWVTLEETLIATYRRVIERSLSELARAGFINVAIGMQDESTQNAIDDSDLADGSTIPDTL